MTQPQTVIMEPPAGIEEVLQTARELAAALAEASEYQVLEQAQQRLRQDDAAQAAIRAFQERQQALGWQVRMGLIGDTEREELQRLQQAIVTQPCVQAYSDAQQRFGTVCQEVTALISEAIGLSFAASCGPGCSCG